MIPFPHLLTVLLLSVDARTHAEDVHVAAGEGRLAVQATADSEWRVLRAGDSVALTGRLKTSPAGPVEIALPGATLVLAADTAADHDFVSRRIQIHQGRVRLVTLPTLAGSWEIVSADIVSVCPPDTELTLSSGRERPQIQILTGQAEIRHGSDPPIVVVGPADDAVGPQRTAIAEHQLEDWRKRARELTSFRPTQGMGQLVMADSQSASPVRLEIARYAANVVLQPPVALIQIDQSFFNPHPRQEEGTFVFNLPPGASVSRFAMYVTHDRLVEGELIDRTRADEVYSTIVRSQRDPAILEQIGDNLFRMRVFPVPTRDTKRILLDFTVPLLANDRGYRFDLPLMSDRKPIWEFSLTGTIHPPVIGNSVRSPSHPEIAFLPHADGSLTFARHQKAVRPPERFSIDYAAPPVDSPSIRLFRPEGNTHYFVATVPARANPITPKEATRPADVLLVVDTSGNGDRLHPALLAARTVAAGLDFQDRLRLGCVDSSYRPLMEDWARPDSIEADAGWRRLREQFSLGFGSLDASLREAATAFASTGVERRKLLIYIGDSEARATGDLDLPGVNLIAIQPKPQVAQARGARGWLARQVDAHHGVQFNFNNRAEPLRDLFEWSMSGLPTHATVNRVEITGVTEGDLYYDPQWLPGRDLHLIGRGTAVNTLDIAIQASGVALPRYSLKVADFTRVDDVLTGRVWAEQRLRAAIDGHGLHPQLSSAEMVAHCQEWSLMSPWTAYLVLETEQDYERWKISRTLRRRYWLPQGTVTASPAPPPRRPLKSEISPEPESEVNAESVRKLLRTAQIHLEHHRPIDAQRALNHVRREALLTAPGHFHELLRQTRKQLKEQTAFRQLHLWQPLMDRTKGAEFPAPRPFLLEFIQGGMSPEFREHFPHADALLKIVPRGLPVEVTLGDFVTFLRQETGLQILVDRQALHNEGFQEDTVLDLTGLDRVSIRALLSEALETIGLDWIPQTHFLKITTMAAADETLFTRNYPVEDLTSDSPPRPDRLSNPFLDREEAVRKRIESHLRTRVSIDVNDVPLSEVVKFIAGSIGEPIRVHRHALQDEQIDPDSTVTLRLSNLPAEIIFDEVLGGLGLTTMIRNEALIVTTIDTEQRTMQSQVYSIAGLDDAISPREFPDLSSRNMAPLGGLGGGLGGFGGFAGAMGGMGGAVGTPKVPRTSPPLEPFDIGPGESFAPQTSPEPPVLEFNEADVGHWVADGWSQGEWIAAVLQTDMEERWRINSGEGGTAEPYPRARSLVVVNSGRMHRHVRDLLEGLRRSLPMPLNENRRMGQSRSSIESPESLLEMVLDLEVGQWMNRDAEGGAAFAFGKVLSVRQTARTHELIYRLLTQLRRACQVADQTAQQTSLAGIDEVSPFQFPSLTILPTLPAPVQPGTADELALLTWRRSPVSRRQRWQSQSQKLGTSEFVIRQDTSRLELQTSLWTIRIDGPRTAVAYPGLTLTELGPWSLAARQLVDGTLPWLPHRTNEELATLFDIVPVREDPGEITLRFQVPGLDETYLEVTYSKLTRQPTRWQSVVGNVPQFELMFDIREIVAHDLQGRELERWKLVHEEPPEPLAEIDIWPGSIVVDTMAGATEPSMYHQIRQLLRDGNYTSARDELQLALRTRPDQPLLNLLSAWASEWTEPADPHSREARKAALKRVAASGADDLIRLLTPATFPSLTATELSQILNSVPEARRSAVAWMLIADSERTARHFEEALVAVDRALALPLGHVEQTELRIRKAELLLRTGHPQSAVLKREDLSSVSNDLLMSLADQYAEAGLFDMNEALYDDVITRSRISRNVLQQVREHQASHFPPGKRRWTLLLQAHDAFPEDSFATENLLGQIRDEARSSNDAQILGELATSAPSSPARTQLKIMQANLLDDPAAAAEVVLSLVGEDRVPDDLRLWAADLLERGGRFDGVVRLLESGLRLGRPLSPRLQAELHTAYSRLGRTEDARRVAPRDEPAGDPDRQP